MQISVRCAGSVVTFEVFAVAAGCRQERICKLQREFAVSALRLIFHKPFVDTFFTHQGFNGIVKYLLSMASDSFQDELLAIAQQAHVHVEYLQELGIENYEGTPSPLSPAEFTAQPSAARIPAPIRKRHLEPIENSRTLDAAARSSG